MQSPSSAILPMQTMSLTCTLAKQVQEATRRYSHVSGTIDLTISRNGGTDSPGLALYMSMRKINWKRQIQYSGSIRAATAIVMSKLS